MTAPTTDQSTADTDQPSKPDPGLGLPAGMRDLLAPLLVPAVAATAILSWFWTRLHHTFALPDYGDLWRMSSTYSVDGQLTVGELFHEGEALTHIPFLHVIVNHLAVTGGDYSLMWFLGAAATVLTSALIGAGVVLLIADGRPTPGQQVLGALAGCLAFRFDSSVMATNSLLLFSQVFYLVAYIGAALVGLAAATATGSASEAQASSSRRNALYAAVFMLLVVGDAPASVLAFSLIALAVTVGVIARNGSAPLFRLLGVVAALSLLARKGVLVVAGAEGRPYASPTERVPTDIALDTLRLLGSSLVDVDAVVSLTARGYDRTHILTGLLLLGVWAVTGLRLVVGRAETGRAAALSAIVVVTATFLVVGAVSIAAIRGLGDNYTNSRMMRTTALAGPVLLLVIHESLRRSRRLSRAALPVTLAAAVLLLSGRGLGLAQTAGNIQATVDFRQRAAATVCEVPRTEERWDQLWSGFDPASIDEFVDSPHLSITSRAGC